jgi:hypothetical protein
MKKIPIIKQKNSPFTATLYTYVKPSQFRFARSFGRRKFGSMAAYLDQLIAADRRRIAAKIDRRYLTRE